MVTLDYRSQNSRRLPRLRHIPRNDANHTSHPDGEWEDVGVHRSSSPASSIPCRRRVKTAFVASRPNLRRRQRQPAQPAKRKQRWRPVQPAERGYQYSEGSSDVDETALSSSPQVEPAEWQQMTELAKDHAPSIFEYIVKVVGDAFHFNRRNFSFALGITIIWLLFQMMTPQLVFFARPMCSLPVVSPRIPLCRHEVFTGPLQTHTSAGRPVRWADYPKLVDMQTKTFDQLLDGSVGNKGLALEVKKAEMASNELVGLVRASGLKSKAQIAGKLSRFVDDARGTGRSLHSLGAKIQGAVDSITSLNDYALQTIEASKAPPSLVARMLSISLSGSKPTKEAVIDTFLMAMDNIASHMARLREEAEISMDHLLRLEEHLMVLHEITHRDNKELKAAQEDVLAEIWTWVGGNKHRLRRMSYNLDLLKNVEQYRRRALAHVAATLQTLHTLDADMEELRTRVAAPEIVGDGIPIEVHIKSIKAGIDRLKERQTRANLGQGESVTKVLENSV